MNEITAWILLGVAAVVVLALGGYAARLWREVRRREDFRRDEIRRANDQCLESLKMIAQAMTNDQVDPIEGSLRCKVLLDIIDPALSERSSFKVFAEVEQRTAHLHTHSARRELTPRARMQEDIQRMAIEDELRADILQAAHEILDFKQRWPASFH